MYIYTNMKIKRKDINKILSYISPLYKSSTDYIQNGGLWSNLLSKTVITTVYFVVEGESVCIRKKQTSVNSTGHDLDVSFL